LFVFCSVYHLPIDILGNGTYGDGSGSVSILNGGMTMCKTPIEARASETRLVACFTVAVRAASKINQWLKTGIVRLSSVPVETLAISFDLIESYFQILTLSLHLFNQLILVDTHEFGLTVLQEK
jgi:hypothetical protein